MDSNVLQMTDIFLEELNVEKMNLETPIEEDQSLEISGEMMYSEEDEDYFRYILEVIFIQRKKVKISLVYDTYFILENFDEKKVDSNYLASEFNKYVWPYLIQEIDNITSKMSINRIKLPSYGVIMNDR
ncbi:hypothetical protein MWH25_04580 [Natroniella acetigena]|uniref:hypothetical protein n=1 Tax=Natroniella acetigena TaxID=52004 RepID=UPI00200AEFE8|nr:hypothetical protein [Natroniella acetigena]MCK8827024.1 hypothetical protein [Natroniella acetigena]